MINEPHWLYNTTNSLKMLTNNTCRLAVPAKREKDKNSDRHRNRNKDWGQNRHVHRQTETDTHTENQDGSQTLIRVLWSASPAMETICADGLKLVTKASNVFPS